MSIFEKYLENHVKKQIEFLTFEEYLDLLQYLVILNLLMAFHRER